MSGEERAGVELTHLGDRLWDGAEATKRDLVDYLDAVADVLLPVVADRPLSVIRVRPGQPPFMQKNTPAYAPEWVRRETIWSPGARRDIAYAVAEDRRTLVWLANQRAVEYHATLFRAAAPERPAELIMDLDPPEGAGFDAVVAAARLVEQALSDAGLTGAIKTSGSKGLHIVVPLAVHTHEDVAAATRALAARAERLDPAIATTAFVKDEREGKVFLDSTRSGGATVVAAYSPRLRPGLTVSYPVGWADLDTVDPRAYTIETVPALLTETEPWHEQLRPEQRLPDDLVAEGHEIPIARVQAMHEGKRRKRAQRSNS